MHGANVISLIVNHANIIKRVFIIYFHNSDGFVVGNIVVGSSKLPLATILGSNEQNERMR